MKRVILFGFLGFVLSVIYGCTTSGSILRGIEETGHEAYIEWTVQQQLSEQPLDSLQIVTSDNQAQEPLLRGGLTITDAAKLALQFNRQLQYELEERMFASGERLSALGNAAPTITANGTYNRDEDKTGFVVDGEQISVDVLDEYSATLSVEMPIFDGGNIASGIRAAKYNTILTEQNIQAAIEETIYQTISGYFRVLLLIEELAVAQNLVELNEQLFQDVLNNREVGIATDFNVLVARVDLSNARTQMQLAQNNVDQAQAQFLRTLGVSQSSNVNLTDELTFYPVQIDRKLSVHKALTKRPEIAGRQMQVQIQEELVRSAYGQYLPSVSLYFDNTWGQPNPAFSSVNKWGSFWNSGIRVRWDIFNLSREGQIRQERSTLKQQQILYYDTKEAVLYEVQSALLALQNARQSVETQQLTLEQGNEGLRQAQVGLREGTLTQVEVQEAQQTFSDAQLAYLNSLYNYEIARLDLQRSTGELRFDRRVDEAILEQLQPN